MSIKLPQLLALIKCHYLTYMFSSFILYTHTITSTTIPITAITTTNH